MATQPDSEHMSFFTYEPLPPYTILPGQHYKIGASLKQGLRLIKQLLTFSEVQQSLKALNVRVDDETLESLVLVLHKLQPEEVEKSK
jgi:hypothetical protein